MSRGAQVIEAPASVDSVLATVAGPRLLNVGRPFDCAVHRISGDARKLFK
jgi:hypothetical protein